eukprot:757656-Hanusia_phi.AAC.7
MDIGPSEVKIESVTKSAAIAQRSSDLVHPMANPHDDNVDVELSDEDDNEFDEDEVKPKVLRSAVSGASLTSLQGKKAKSEAAGKEKKPKQKSKPKPKGSAAKKSAPKKPAAKKSTAKKK